MTARVLSAQCLVKVAAHCTHKGRCRRRRRPNASGIEFAVQKEGRVVDNTGLFTACFADCCGWPCWRARVIHRSPAVCDMAVRKLLSPSARDLGGHDTGRLP